MDIIEFGIVVMLDIVYTYNKSPVYTGLFFSYLSFFVLINDPINAPAPAPIKPRLTPKPLAAAKYPLL